MMQEKFVLKRIAFQIMAPTEWTDEQIEKILEEDLIDDLDDTVREIIEINLERVSKDLTVEESTRKL